MAMVYGKIHFDTRTVGGCVSNCRVLSWLYIKSCLRSYFTGSSIVLTISPDPIYSSGMADGEGAGFLIEAIKSSRSVVLHMFRYRHFLTAFVLWSGLSAGGRG